MLNSSYDLLCYCLEWLWRLCQAVIVSFRIIYAAIFAVAIAYLAVPSLRILTGMEVSAQDVSDGTLIFDTVWDSALILFAGHLILLGWLFCKAKYTPTWIAPFLVVAGLGYGIDSVGRLFTDSYTIEIATVAFVGEVILIFWLLIQGRQIDAKPLSRA